MTVEERTGASDQELSKTVVYHRTLDGINGFRRILEPISPVNFWHLGGDFQLEGETANGSVHLQLDGQNGKTNLHIELVATTSSGEVYFDLEEPLIEGGEEDNDSSFSHNKLSGANDKPLINSEHALSEITNLKRDLTDLIPSLRRID